MPVVVSNTPNPNALKFTVGEDVGGPLTYVAGSAPDNEMAAELVAIEGVTSMFATADFITLSKQPDASWEYIAAAAQTILERYFD
ncbi:MAG: scaffolding protein [bacterium]|nr:scaffolding protein [bacterium]